MEQSLFGLPFSCRIAYLPGFFFAPLLTEFHDNRHRECASQGIWLTISTILSAFLIPHFLQIGIQHNLFTLDVMTSSYQNWTPENWLGKFLILIFYHWILYPLFLYVPVNSLHGFFQGVRSPIPYKISILGNIRLLPICPQK